MLIGYSIPSMWCKTHADASWGLMAGKDPGIRRMTLFFAKSRHAQSGARSEAGPTRPGHRPSTRRHNTRRRQLAKGSPRETGAHAPTRAVGEWVARVGCEDGRSCESDRIRSILAQYLVCRGLVAPRIVQEGRTLPPPVQMGRGKQGQTRRERGATAPMASVG